MKVYDTHQRCPQVVLWWPEQDTPGEYERCKEFFAGLAGHRAAIKASMEATEEVGGSLTWPRK